MSKKTPAFSSITLLSVAVGLFLLLSGVLNFVDQNSFLGQVSGLFVDKSANVVNVVFAVLKIVSGAVLLAGPFGLLTSPIRQLAFWVIVGFWALLVVWVGFGSLGAFKADAKAIAQWFQTLSLNLAILAALWQLKPDSK